MAPIHNVAKAPKRAVQAGLHPTENDLPKTVRQRMVALLQARLVDAVDLTMQCKQAHWTVKGPHFAALHALFDEAHEEMRGHMDLVAERAAALGGQIDGTVQGASNHSSLPAYPVATQAGMEHVAALGGAFACFAKHVRQSIDEATQAEDAVTADTFTQIASSLDKRLWMLEAHRQG